MPKFTLYSLLDKNLMKSLLIKMTQIDDKEIDEIREKYDITVEYKKR